MNADVIKRQRRVCFAQIPVTRRWPAELVNLTFCCPSKSTRQMRGNGWERTSTASLAQQRRWFCRKGLSVLNVQRMSLATWRRPLTSFAVSLNRAGLSTARSSLRCGPCSHCRVHDLMEVPSFRAARSLYGHSTHDSDDIERERPRIRTRWQIAFRKRSFKALPDRVRETRSAGARLIA